MNNNVDFFCNTIHQSITDLLTNYSKQELLTLMKFYNIYNKDIIVILPYIAYLNIKNVKTSDLRVKFKESMYDVSDTCLKSEQFTLNPSNLLGSGTYGVVYEVVDKTTNVIYVYKLQLINNIYTFKKENEIHKLLSKHGIGPTLISYWICPPETLNGLRFGITVMEKWDGDGTQLFDSMTLENVHTLLTLVKQMHYYGIIHFDLKLLNVLYKKQNEEYQVTISDFGLARYKHSFMKKKSYKQTITSYYKWINERYYNKFPTHIKQEAFELIPLDKILTDPFYYDLIFIYILFRYYTDYTVSDIMDIITKDPIVFINNSTHPFEYNDTTHPFEDIETTQPFEDIETTQPFEDIDTTQPFEDIETTQLFEDIDRTQPFEDIETTQPFEDAMSID